MRTIIDLPPKQVESLDAWCKQEGISRAEAVRRAVADHLEKHQTAARGKAFGAWRGRPENEVDYQRALREEWESRERGWS